MIPKIEFIINAAEIDRGLYLDRRDPEDRVLLIGMIDVLFDALEASFDDGLARDRVALWLDDDICEGSLFRALSADIPSLLTFEFDIGDNLEAAIDNLSDATAKFKPEAFVIPVNDAASDISKPSRPSATGNPASQLDKVVNLYDFISTLGVPMAWDIRGAHVEGSNPMLRHETALRTIALFQDIGLDPMAWIMNMPPVRVIAQTLNARVHIDDRNDVMACFALEAVTDSAIGNKPDTLTVLPDVVSDAVTTAAEMPGNVKVVIDNEVYGDLLVEYLHSNCRASEAADAIAQRLSAVSKLLRVEYVSV